MCIYNTGISDYNEIIFKKGGKDISHRGFDKYACMEKTSVEIWKPIPTLCKKKIFQTRDI